MTVPKQPKIYHIVHIDRLQSIITNEQLYCDAQISKRTCPGTTIGMQKIKTRRLQKLLNCHRDLCVGDCVPFYFCPRSVMLYLIHVGNYPELTYHGGQEPIIHLEADLHTSVAWAERNNKRWAFTLSNAGAYYFEDRNDLNMLNEIDWQSVNAHTWSGEGVPPTIKEHKMAEFLLEDIFPWHLVEKIGVYSQAILQEVIKLISAKNDRPQVEIMRKWYYP